MNKIVIVLRFKTWTDMMLYMDEIESEYQEHGVNYTIEISYLLLQDRFRLKIIV